MIKHFCVCFIAASACCVSISPANAQSPFALQYGYSLGMSSSFKNRLPTPPYFAVYPPVYYGKRYARPYGDSPYASWPTLQAAPGYYAEPMEGHLINPKVVFNHHSSALQNPVRVETESQPVAAIDRFAPIVIVNPFATEQYASLPPGPQK